jgi:hypothetical protein
MLTQAKQSKAEIFQTTLKVRDKIIKVLKDNGYNFKCNYNDLYFLKSGQIVRRLKGMISLTTSKYPEGEWTEESNKRLREYYTIDNNTFLKVKELIQSFSTDEFDCDFNKLRLNTTDHCGHWGEEFTYILKIANK